MKRDSASAAADAAPQNAAGPVHVIDLHGVYTVKSATAALGLKPGCLPREIRLSAALQQAGGVLLDPGGLAAAVAGGRRDRPQGAGGVNGEGSWN